MTLRLIPRIANGDSERTPPDRVREAQDEDLQVTVELASPALTR